MVFNTVIAPDGQSTSVITVTSTPCPVSLQAKHGSGSGLVMVRRRQAPDLEPEDGTRPAQNIHLILGKSATEKRIASVTVSARGLSPRGRIERAISVPPSDVRRTLESAVSTDSDGTLFAEITLPGFTVVTSIKLESIHFADGSNWDLSGRKTCSVAPDPFMLIGAQ